MPGKGVSRPFSAIPFLGALVLTFSGLACTPSTNEPTIPSSHTPRTVFVNATRVPTVTPSPIPTLPSPTPTPTSTPAPTAEPLTEREAYCRDHALPTATPEPGETPTPVPTSPPGIPEDEIPPEWTAKMDEIEAWAREFYEMDDETVGEFKRSVIEEEVWREWRKHAVEDWAGKEDSTVQLWEQINRTLTLLSPESRYAEFIAEYQGDRYIGLYNPEKREIIIRGDIGDFDVRAVLTYLHEYSHHLQNEKYDFVTWDKCFESDGDAQSALFALIEGDASNTEYEYIENVIGWDRLQEYYDRVDDKGLSELDEPKMVQLRDQLNSFRYGTGSFFVFMIRYTSNCETCETERQKIDEVFERPPYTTEQIYREAKYFDGEGREPLSLPDDVLGDEWELRFGTTIGRSDWIALLTTLANSESDEIEPQHPGWRGDYGMLFEDEDGRALYLQVAEWENRRYIDSLVSAFDEQSRLKRIRADNLPGRKPFEDLYFWRGDTGAIAIGVELQPADRFYTMFSAVGPGLETVEDAIYASRDKLITADSAEDSDTGWAD